ncbi:MAG: DUF5908 family protein [Bacteroidota bacterium]
MPIEIKELHIKINVNDGGQTNASQDKQAGGKSANTMEETIDQIMQIEQRKNER